MVREQIAILDDLRAHAEKMIKSGATATEAAQRYVVPGKFKSFQIFSWGFTVGASMVKYYAELKK